MDIYKLLKELTLNGGVSGSDDFFGGYAEKILKSYCEKTTVDKIGNVIGCIPSKKPNAKKLMVEAHLDRIGLMVKAIDKNGYVEFEPIGGVDKRILPSAEVIIQGKKEIYGVIGAKPPHLREKGESSVAEVSDMLIDVGMTYEKASTVISTGDFIVLKSEPVRLINDRIAGAALDNRAGMAAVVCFLEKLKNKAVDYDIYPVFTAGEETGLIGAYTAAYNINPDISVSVDVTFGKSEYDSGAGTFKLGCGAVIFRGPDTSYEGTLNLIECAKKEKIPFEIEAAASSGTNASAIQNARGAAETYLISIPLKYMHQTVEVVSESDIEAVSELLLKIAEGGASRD